MTYSFLTSTLFYEIVQQVILGFIQGITEFLPISSTAHLVTIPRLLGWGDPGVTTIASIQLGSIAAILIYFWRDLLDIFKSLLDVIYTGHSSNPKSTLALSILIGNIPIVIVGIIIKFFWSNYQNSIFRSSFFIGLISILMALLMAFSEQVGKRERNLDNIKIKDGVYVGLSQVLAFIPGVSRSGITISTSLISGLERSSSARFSFLLGVPAISLAGFVELKTAFAEFSFQSLIFLFIGIFTAAITSLFAIDFLIKYLRRYSTIAFVYYRLFFGFFLLFLSF